MCLVNEKGTFHPFQKDQGGGILTHPYLYAHFLIKLLFYTIEWSVISIITTTQLKYISYIQVSRHVDRLSELTTGDRLSRGGTI